MEIRLFALDQVNTRINLELNKKLNINCTIASSTHSPANKRCIPKLRRLLFLPDIIIYITL
jgi:hypothetical protein